MDRNEEKDLYIKGKLKDSNIPEKIDNLFNNSAKLVENIEPPKKNKNQIIIKRVAGIAACAVIILGGGNIYATTQGYDNVFFMIKEWVAPSTDVHGKDGILSDRDITISYKSIEVAKGIKIQINRLVVKDDDAKLYLKIDKSETELDKAPFTYIVRDENGKEICNYTSAKQENIYTEELKLEGIKMNAKKLELEVIQNDDSTLVKFEINLESKEIQVIGNEYEIQKISEEELKKYLGTFALLNYEESTKNTDIPENTEGLCIDVIDIMYSNGIYTVTFTYCYPTPEDISENRIEDLALYEMTIGLTINEDETYSKYCVSSKMEAMLIKEGKDEELIKDISYVEIQVDNSGENGLSYTDPLKIENQQIIDEIKNIINNGEKVIIQSVGGFWESCPIITIYQENGEIFTVTAIDGFEMEGEPSGNLIAFSRKQDQSDKVMYRVDKELGAYIERIYDNNMDFSIAISERYNAIPREYETITELPKELSNLTDYTTVDIQAIDLDGDGEKEYIVCYTEKNNSEENEKTIAKSGIMLFNNKYKKVADVVTLEDTNIFLTIEDVEYIDIDNDGNMEVITKLPQYEGSKISIIKYKNGVIEGETDIKATLEP